MRVACVNPGSSSLKLSLLDGDELLFQHHVDAQDADEEVERMLQLHPDAAALRVVHGGARFTRAVVVDDEVQRGIEEVSELAPLHNPPALRALSLLLRSAPGLTIVACFDTAFHAGLPDFAAIYPVPAEWTRRWGLRRFGFHGLNHAYASRRAAELAGHPLARVVTCHLGAGASLAAVRDGRSIDTTMGFTPLEGLMMATRSGSVDPGMMLFALSQGVTAAELEQALDRRSGLLGVSEVSADYRRVREAADQGNRGAALALAMYSHRLRQGIAAMVASLGGIDALVFTGGVGENSAELRADTCIGLGFLGVTVDLGLNSAIARDGVVSPPGAVPMVLAVRAREDLEMARQVTELLGPSRPATAS